MNWANLLTLARIFFIPVFVAILHADTPFRDWIAAVVFCILAATDAVDGYIARKQKKVTKFGIILDPVADKLLIMTALIFLIEWGVPVWMAWAIIAREFAVLGFRLLVSPNVIISASILGKLKTAAEMAGIVSVLLDIPFAWWILLVAVVLSVVSALQYFWRARKAIEL